MHTSLNDINVRVYSLAQTSRKLYQMHTLHGNVILTKFLSLVAPEVAILATSGATNDESFVKMATFPSRCSEILSHESSLVSVFIIQVISISK